MFEPVETLSPSGLEHQEDLARNAGVGRAMLPLAVAICIVLGVAGLSYRDWSLYTEALGSTERAETVLKDTQALLSSLIDAETGQRGYMLTGKDEYLNPYRKALAEVHAEAQQLAGDVQSPANKARLSDLQKLLAEKLEELEKTIALRNAKGLGAALAVVQTDRGQELMERIRTVCTEIGESVTERLRLQQEQAARSAANLRFFSVFGSGALLSLLLLAHVVIRRATGRQQMLIQALTEQKRRIAQARDIFETTLRSIGDAVIATDMEGRITFINAVAQNLTGWNDRSAVGLALQRVFRIVNETTRESVENPVEKVIRSGRVVGLANHTILLAADGREIPIDDSAAPIRNSAGHMIGTVLVFRDVAARRRSEREIKRSRQELERTNAALRESNADLELFSYAAGHDLREPIRTIGSFSQLIARRLPPDAESQEHFHLIQQAVHRMTALVDDLLEYSHTAKLESQTRAVVNVNQALGEALWNLQSAISDSGAKVTADSLPKVMGSHQSLVRLFQNLIGNAIKYRSEQPPKVYVSAQSTEEGEWTFAVQDNGIGLEMRYAQDIFTVFRRLHGNDQYPGTGIGLALCKRIVEMHGGRIWVESEPGAGSTFRFTLPIDPQE
jgi:PAS domain S-box-containing protein